LDRTAAESSEPEQLLGVDSSAAAAVGDPSAAAAVFQLPPAVGHWKRLFVSVVTENTATGQLAVLQRKLGAADLGLQQSVRAAIAHLERPVSDQGLFERPAKAVRALCSLPAKHSSGALSKMVARLLRSLIVMRCWGEVRGNSQTMEDPDYKSLEVLIAVLHANQSEKERETFFSVLFCQLEPFNWR
jgi:hypothetical protein